MENIFIKNIHIDKVRNLENFNIEISQTEKKHLILTGKNGSGKTSLLETMAEIWNHKNIVNAPERAQKKIYKKDMIKQGINIGYNVDFLDNELRKSMILLYIKAERNLKMKRPSTVTKEADIIDNINNKREITAETSVDFLQRMVNLYFLQLSAEKKQDFEKAKILEDWFSDFTNQLKRIYKSPELKIDFDEINFKYNIIIPDREPFGLNEMADGYAAFIRIIIELMNLMEAISGKYCDYSIPGIVLVDEIETHLHIELQKEIMPFLTDMFPNVQFIVSTHSPFVISSIRSAVVFDLENKRRIEGDLSVYSLNAIVESYFDIDTYSDKIKKVFEIYKNLCFKERTEEENYEFLEAKAKLELVPPAATELYSAFNELESQRKAVSPLLNGR